MGCVGVQARGGLVQEDESGIAQQRYADVTALGLPACTGITSLSGHTYTHTYTCTNGSLLTRLAQRSGIWICLNGVGEEHVRALSLHTGATVLRWLRGKLAKRSSACFTGCITPEMPRCMLLPMRTLLQPSSASCFRRSSTLLRFSAMVTSISSFISAVYSSISCTVRLSTSVSAQANKTPQLLALHGHTDPAAGPT